MEMHRKTKTFLSPNVRHLVIEIGEGFYQNAKEDYNSPLFLTEKLTFDWKNIATLFGDLPADVHLQSVDWFEDILHKFWPVFAVAHHTLLCQTRAVSADLWELCMWTRKELEIKKYFYLFLNSEVCVTEAVLFLTSVLERSLGNIVLLKGQNVPSLLRDLLIMPELASILGPIPIAFLQILMGTPLALNLRNLAWHGFPQPDELPPQFVSTLFLITASVGELLSVGNIGVNAIPMRPQICFTADLFDGCFPDVNSYYEEVLQILASSPFIDSSHFIYWKSGLEHYMNSEFGACLLLLLPQFEHMLRCIFCSSNHCIDRVLTAESTTLYITLTEIMAEHLHSDHCTTVNNIRLLLGDVGIEMLQDLFIHQSGPRIRDKLSHGECDLAGIPRVLTNHVVCVALVMTLKAEEGQLCSATRPNSLEDLLMIAYGSYVSRFHQSSMLQMSIVSGIHNLDMWQTYPRPDEIADNDFNCKVCDESELSLLQSKLLATGHSGENNFDVLCSKVICDYVSSVKTQTVFRPKRENEILTILKHVLDSIKLIDDQVKQNLRYKFELHSRHEMRSRQRGTYQRMLNLLPFFNQVLSCIFLIVAIQLREVNLVDLLQYREYQQKLKLFKHILQFVENAVSHTTIERNRWEEVSVLAQRFIHTTNQALCKNIL